MLVCVVGGVVGGDFVGGVVGRDVDTSPSAQI